MSPPTSAAELFAYLDELGLSHETIEHPPVYTVEEAKAHRGPLDGAHIKNLFLRNKKKRMWLVIAMEDRKIDLRALGKRIGAGHVSFGRPERLMTYLGVEPGSVSPFGLINDKEQKVQAVLDSRMFDKEVVHAHPLRNDMTTAIRGEDLLTFIRACGHEAQIIDFDELLPDA